MQQRPAPRRAAARAHRRADASRRARGELLVSAPPRRVRVDRRAGARAAGRRSRLRRGLRRRRPRPDGRRGGGGRREPRGPRACPPALPAREPALRARAGGASSPALRRDRLPADDRARRGARALLERLAAVAPLRLRLHPEPAHPRSAGRGRSPTTRGTCASTRRPSTGRCWSRASRGWRCSASSTPASCAFTSWRCGWVGTGSIARCGSRSRSTSASFPRSRPRTSSSGGAATSIGRSTSSPSAVPSRDRGASEAVGDLAIVLHSHMPYVEGFGTYPFGEEWLFDAVARSYLDVLEAARDLTVTVTPVLADQLEAPGVAERMRAFLRRYRLEAAERDASRRLRSCARRPRPRPSAIAARSSGWRSSRATCCCRSGARRSSATSRWCLRRPRTRSCRWSPPRAGRRLQIDAGLRSHRRRFGSTEGFWLPECAYRPGLEALLAERGLRFFCCHQSALERPARQRWRRLAPALEWCAFTLDWEAVELVWSKRGYPSDPAYVEFHRLSVEGIRLWAIGGGPYDPAAARRRAGCSRRGVHRRRRSSGWPPFGLARGRPGLVVFAVDTELLGHWWSEGPIWLEAVLRLARRAGVRLVTLPQALERHPPEERQLSRIELGRGQGPSHLGLAGRSRPGLGGEAAGAAAAARRERRRRWPGGQPSARRASCSRFRRATGRSWTSVARRATTRTGARPPMPVRRWKPYTPPSRRTPACETWPPTSASLPSWSPESTRPWSPCPRSSCCPGSTRR